MAKVQVVTPNPWINYTTAEAIREVAAMLFQQQGYQATTLRQVAAEVGIKVGSLYNHISSKEELLLDLMVAVMDDLLKSHDAAVEGKLDPLAKLRAAVDAHIRFHASHARHVFVGNSELRSLRPADRRTVIRKRDEYQHELTAILDEAAACGAVDVVDTRLQTYAIVAIGAHVATWYRPDGPLSLEQIVEQYTEIILRQLGRSAGSAAG